MNAVAEELDTSELVKAPAALSRHEALGEDAHWQRAHSGEGYYRAGLDYEDYAPAYCVGYMGYAQYGGEFDDAERSLCANWERIKGDSRLSFDEALPAMRAAWSRVAGR
ncbi:hypothetical protein [Ramlibacter sp. WS9]|uniref:hypothetical protein n=1 Tax=Ramlibacter sp. WS9 TaxID=1882741 RepID=UPI0011448797|nr:hypothetical protein [Ramlibacter sp. WS9]ROZ76936.1 hypothetical protein EEB15_10090 [Ramlibacter sp. WS9]